MRRVLTGSYHLRLSAVINHGPQLVSCILVLAIAAEVARAALPLMSGHLSDQGPPTRANNSTARRAAGVDTASIVAAHLFGAAAAEGGGDPAAAGLTTDSLILDGIVATDNPRRGMAIITASGTAGVYRIGEQVEGAALHLIYRDHVILVRGGRFEKLSLREFAPAGAGMVAPESEAAPRPRALAEFVSADASTDDSEHLQGFHLRATGAARAQFFRSGLRPGDLLTGVNGTSLTDQDPKHGQEIVDATLTGARATMSVVRNGKPMDVSVDLGAQ